MAIDAGTLEVRMMMGLARLQQDVTQAKDIVGRGMAGIESAARAASTVLGALGAALSAGAFVSLIKGSIDALDSLNDLSKTTRIAVDDLAGLRYAAQLSGTTLDAAAGAVNKLATNMGKNAEKFAALGVSARDPVEAFKQLADVTNAIQDPQQRAAVLAEALGKSWQQVAPLLAEGSAKIGEMVGKGKELAGVTPELVKQADEFNDKLVELSGNGGKVNALLVEMLPLLNATADGLLDNGKATTIWSAAGKVFAEILRTIVVLAGNVGFVLRGIGNDLGALYAAQAAFLTGDFARGAQILRQMTADGEANRKSFDAWEASIMAVGAAAQGTTKALDAQDQVSRRMAQDASASARAFMESEKRRKESEEEQKRLFREAEKLRKEDIAGWVKYADAVFDEADRLNLDLAKISDRRWKEEDKNRQRSDAEWVKHIDLEIEEYERGLKEMAKLHPSFIESWTRQWDQLSSVIGDFFADLVMNGKSAFDNLKRFVKQLLAEMIALFAKRWVLNMAAGGSVLGSAGQAVAGGVGSDSLAGSVLNWGSTAIGLTGAGGAAGMFVGGVTGAIPSAAIGSGAVAAGVGVESGAAALGSSLSGVYSALAAIPVWGWIAMAVIAIGAWIAGNKAGGPKVGGSFFSGGAVPGTDNGRFFTPSQGDAQMQQLVMATSQGYTDAITRLGGTAGGFNFGLGFDHDPNGSARSRVSSLVTDAAGNRIYGVSDLEMDDKEVPAALGLESGRMIIAALQASELGPELDKFFDSITDIASLTQEQINGIIAQATELKNVVDALAAWDIGLTVDGLRAMAIEGETLSQTLGAVSQGFQQYRQLFFTEEENQAFSMERMRKEFEKFGLTMPTTREGFRQLVEGIDKTTEEGAKLWRWLITIAPAFADIVPPLQDVNDVVEDVADTAVAAVELISAAMNQNTREWDDIFRRYYAGAGARKGIGDYLTGLLTGDSSPLDPMERFGAAQGEYQRVLGLAQGGDIDAMMKLPSVHKMMIDLARSIWGSSSAFVSLFESSFNEVAKVGEVPDYQSRMLKIQTDSAKVQLDIYSVLIDIREGVYRSADAEKTTVVAAEPERR